MTSTRTFVIVGAGLAGAKAAEALRVQGFDGRIVLIGDEPHRPYERPPLSKGYLAGKSERGQVFVHPHAWYADHDVDLRLGQAVIGINRVDHHIALNDGTHLGYEKLLLATGSSPRRLPVPGANADGVHYLRRLEDCEVIKEVLATCSKLVVIGGGWIGLEVTAVARQAGVEVTVVEAAKLPLVGVLGWEVAEVFTRLHREHGVDMRLGSQATAIVTENGRASGVQLASGTTIDADAVVVGVGIRPNTGLAQQAGLQVDNGIVVASGLRTNDPDISAAGDVANAFHPFLGRHIRVEHWANALNQPATAAARMLDREAVYDELPYFFTDQYDLGMEYVGHVQPGGYDRVIFRGDVAARRFIAFWCKDNRVLAGMNVNIWDVTDQIKTLIRSWNPIDPSALADPDLPLNQLTQQ
ncbi:NAD(P)/FAD-dependent oxidoreductase [Actinoallomurus vinaceus]|uniref:NAD(P)/FAD-dependent oxidoreductase n=1 Tax=Actinoallomurus vinaceus TaxID=1080074 RepID=UPI0031EAE8A2